MLIGHQSLQQQVADLSAAATLPHALLIHGEKGIGKRTLCNHLAQFLICGGTYTAGQGIGIDQSRPAYAQLQAGAYPDLHILERLEQAASISVSETRHLLERLTWTADGKRVIIIDSLDELNPEAANTLLKTLEEPGQGVHFLLVCHQLSKILPTILSRCRKLAAQSLTPAETRQVLEQNELPSNEIETMLHLYPTSPGQGMAFGQTGIILQTMLAEAFAQPEIGLTKLADHIAQKKQVPQALDLLLTEIHTQARQVSGKSGNLAAEIYAEILSLKKRQNTHNLSANWVLETACTRAAHLQIAGKLPLFCRP